MEFPIKTIIERDEASGEKRTGDKKFIYGTFTFNPKAVVLREDPHKHEYEGERDRLMANLNCYSNLEDNSTDDEMPELEHATTDDELA